MRSRQVVEALKQFLAIFSFHEVMVADGIVDRQTHVGGVHELNMCAQTVVVAYVAGVDNEGRALIGRVAAQIVNPVLILRGVENLGVGDMQERVGSVGFYTGVVRYQAEIVGGGFGRGCNIMPVESEIARWSGDENKASAVESRQ